MTSDENVPDQTLTFADLGLDEPMLAVLRDVGYETPSPIQAQTVPLLLAGGDVVGLAQTGTGKTAAFALPILDRLDLRQKKPQALVLAPTRELALQVCEAFERYAAHLDGVHVLPVYGGQAYGIQLSALRRGVHIVVGTPGRIMDHLDRGTLDLSELRYVVLDEADEMLKMGFAEDVDTILGATPPDKQVALFSATMPPQIRRIAQRHLNNPTEVIVKQRTTTSSTINQRYVVVAYRQKLDALARLLEVENFEAAIVFTRTKNETETVAQNLRARGLAATAINGDVVQAQRERTIAQLRDGQLDVLVATDVAARGLDVERISHVFNYDLPVDTESYVHRVGRTGRAGRTGDAISFVTPRERRLLQAIEKATRQPLTHMQLPTVSDVNASRLARFDDSITAALEQRDRVDRFRDIVNHYVEHHDVPEADVAAALAVVAQGDSRLLLDEHEEIESGSLAPARGGEGRDDAGPGRRSGGRSGDGSRVTYRLSVGRRHKVEPRQIVGAIANEGGLSRSDFGAIAIRPDFSLVELPADLPQQVLDKLARTRISGQLIEIQVDRGPGGGGGGGKRSYSRDGGRDSGRDGGRDSGGRGGRDDRGGRDGGRDGGRSRDDRLGGGGYDRGGDRNSDRGYDRGRDDRGRDDRGRAGGGGYDRGRDDRSGGRSDDRSNDRSNDRGSDRGAGRYDKRGSQSQPRVAGRKPRHGR